MKEHDLVVLTHDIGERALRAGDVGTIVHSYGGGSFEVEFVSAGGDTIAILTLSEADLRAMAQREILHVRKLAAI